jgi:hypothetical protein
MVRDMPHCWRARLDLPRGSTVTALSATASVTSSVAVKLRAPLGPFTSMVWPETEADTPDGSSTGRLPIRDICHSPQNTVQSTSPPTLAWRALASVITPLDVETMETPRP